MKLFRAFPFNWGGEEKEKEFLDATILVQAETVEDAFVIFGEKITNWQDEKEFNIDGCDMEEVPFKDGVEDIFTEPIRVEV